MWPKKNKRIAIGLGVLLVLLLAAVRAFETSIFYDPFISYYKNDYQTLTYPEFNSVQLLASYSFRFALNTLLSLMLLYVLFADKTMLKVAGALYGLFFAGLILLFFALFYFYQQPSAFVVFYVRRFLIQPLFIILFIPAFYYQKRQ